MSDPGEEVNPDNPRCPTCGAVDWFADPRWDYMLHYASKPGHVVSLETRRVARAISARTRARSGGRAVRSARRPPGKMSASR
jgi:hypothetical protein